MFMNGSKLGDCVPFYILGFNVSLMYGLRVTDP
jgi:hypothetical protein